MLDSQTENKQSSNFLKKAIGKRSKTFMQCFKIYLFSVYSYIVSVIKSERFLIKWKKFTVVGDYINIMKTTFDLNIDLYQAFKQHGYTKTWKQRETVNLKSFTLFTCKLAIKKKLVQIKMSSSLYWYYRLPPYIKSSALNVVYNWLN